MQHDRDYWLKTWETKDIFFHRNEVNPDLMKFFPKLNLPLKSRIFVPLCGKSQDMLWLANSGYLVIGVELSPIACEEFFAEQNVTPQITKFNNFTLYEYQNFKLFCGDIFKITHADIGQIDAIYDSKALIALPHEVRKKYINHLLNLANPKTQIFLITIETNDQVQGPPYPVSQVEVNNLFGSDRDITIVKSGLLDRLKDHLINKGYKQVLETIYIISML